MPFQFPWKLDDVGMVCHAEDVDLLTFVPQLLVKGGARFGDDVISHYLLIVESVKLLLVGQLSYPIGHIILPVGFE